MAAKRTNKITIRFDVKTSLDERDGYFARYLEGFGITVYGRDRNDVDERSTAAIRVWVNAFAPYPNLLAIRKIREFFDRHGIKHSVTKEVVTPAPRMKRWQTTEHRFDGARQEFALATA